MSYKNVITAHIPSNPEYSFKLATAVQVLAYEIRMASLAMKTVICLILQRISR